MSTGLSTLYPVLSIFFVFAIALLLLPVPGFVHTRNASVLFYVAWLVLGNFAYGLNTFLWRGNTTNRSPVYCDIVTFLIAMLPIGIACSLLCINRLVWNISRSSTLFLVNNPRRNRVDTLICIVVPFMFGALRLLVQDKRFTIVEDVGCIPSVDHTLPALFIYYLPPSLICCCITSIYCTLSIINFCKNRYMSSSLLPNDARHAMTPNQFLRLTLLCITSFVFSALFLLSMLVKNVQIGLSSWTTWSSATWNFNRIEVLNRLDLDTLPHQKQLLGFQLLLLPVLAVHFFLFFGFGNEAVRQYRATLGWLGRFPRRLVRHERKQSDLTPVTDELDQLPRGTVVTGFRMTMIKKRGPAWMQSVPPPVRISPPSQGPQDIVLIGNTPPRTPTPPLSLPSRPEPTSPPPLMSPRRTSALAQTQSQIRLSLNNSNLRRLSSLMYRRTPTASRRNSAERHLQPPISPVYIIPSPIQAEAASPNRSSTSSISVSVGHFPFPPSPHFPDTHLPIPTSLRFVSHRASSASVVKSPLDEAVAPKPQRATMADVEKGLHSRSFSQNVPAFFA
ncbi:a-factor receptor, partial [Serendipita sp. 405]